MTLRLPLEIEYFILDLLADDDQLDAIRQYYWECSRVCRAWARKCQPILFRRITILRPTRDEIHRYRRRFDRLAHLSCHVREIRLWEGWQCYPVYTQLLVMVLSSLPSVTTLWLRCRERNPLHSHPYFSPRRGFMLPNIVNVELMELTLENISELYQHLALFPNLETLTIVNFYWKETGFNKSGDSEGRELRENEDGAPSSGSIPLKRLRLGLETKDVAVSRFSKTTTSIDYDAYKEILKAFAWTTSHLDINLGMFYCLTTPEFAAPEVPIPPGIGYPR
ncbi:hypothetical protein OH77DRAFT_1590905 [Trametes cingulata]|nr:hypothetical protein OH77DRAFT_1590905 [Trametes cingulata]